MAEYSVAPPNFLPPTLPILFLEDAIQYDPMEGRTLFRSFQFIFKTYANFEFYSNNIPILKLTWLSWYRMNHLFTLWVFFSIPHAYSYRFLKVAYPSLKVDMEEERELTHMDFISTQLS